MELFGLELSMWILWFSLAVILLIIEFVAPGIIAVFFSFGAILAGTISIFTESFLVQVIVFILTSFVTMIFARSFLERHFLVNQEVKPSTVDALKGKIGVVIKPMTLTDKGLVKLNGEDWTAKPNSDDVFIEGEKVLIVGVEGVTLVIEKLKGGE